MEVEKMDKSQTYPDFFKVFLPEDSLGKMLIPAAFISCLDKKLPGKTILRNRLGSIWQVKVIYTKNDVFFEDGWVNFIKDNSLAFGDFLVFRYNGDCIFHFRIYEISPSKREKRITERSGCEKEDVRASQSIGRLSNDKEEEEEREEQACKDDDNGNNIVNGPKEDEEEPKPRANTKIVGGKAKPCGRGRRKKGLPDLEGCKVRSAVKTKPNEQSMQATQRAINAPRMYTRPSFVAIIRVYNVVKNYMLVPADFARICELQVTKFINLRVSNNEWCVRCVSADGKTRLSMGWAAFVSDNDLKVGDVCKFELVRASDTLLEVTISRF